MYLFVCVFKINPWKWYHKATKIKHVLLTIQYLKYCLVTLDVLSLQYWQTFFSKSSVDVTNFDTPKTVILKMANKISLTIGAL